MSTTGDLEGRTAVITGASRGIGKAIALHFFDNGVDVTLAARSRDDLEAVAAHANDRDAEALVVPTDVTETEDVVHLFDRAFERFGTVDVLVNNAGRYQDGAKPTWEISSDEWEAVLDVNLHGMHRCASEVLRRGMLDQEAGWILNMSSLFGKTGIENSAAYVASKHGIQGLTNTLARELKDTDIRVTAICPGQVETELTEGIRSVELLDPEDVVGVVDFVLRQEPTVYVPEIVVTSPDSIPLFQH